MYRGWLTPRETEIIHHLLLQRGITEYSIVEANEEGLDLPGCAYNWEVQPLCVTAEAPDARYNFWVGWKDDQYILKYWREETVRQISVMA